MLLATSFALASMAAAVFAVWAVGTSGLSAVQSLEVAFTTILAGMAVAVLRRPSGIRAARVADRRAALQDRLATALEIIEGRMSGELAPLQLAETWHAVDGISPRSVLPFRGNALRNTSFTAVLMGGLALLVIGHAEDLRSTIDRLLQDRQSVALEAPLAANEATAPLDADVPIAPGIIPQDASATTSARLRDQLQQQDQQSRTIEEAVAKLADALKGTAAAGDVAASLQRHDYGLAAEQMRDLARESDQLSTSAKQELARAFLQASKDSARSDQSLAVAEQEAARALGRGDYQGGRAALEKLADLVSSQERALISSAEVAKRLQDMKVSDLTGQASANSCGGGDDYAAPVDCSQGPLYSTGGMRAQVQSGDSPSPLAGSGEIRGGGGYAAGGGDTTNPLGEAVTQLEAQADTPVVVDVNPTSAQGRGGQPDSKAETKIISQNDQKNAALSGVPQTDQPISDAPESTIVSPGQRQTVRSFFRSSAR